MHFEKRADHVPLTGADIGYSASKIQFPDEFEHRRAKIVAASAAASIGDFSPPRAQLHRPKILNLHLAFFNPRLGPFPAKGPIRSVV